MTRPLLAAALAWYDEPLASLDRCIRSLVGVVDVLVPLDGRWQGFADNRPAASPAEQRELVLDLTAELDVDFHTINVPPPLHPFESQVAKRRMLYRLAAELADWVLVIDADEHVEHRGPEFRFDLREAVELVGLVGCRTVRGPQSNAGTSPIPRLFCSCDGGLTVEQAHNGIRTGGGRWLAGDHAYVDLEPPVDLSAQLVLFHDQGASRPELREQQDRDYRRARVQGNLEQWHRVAPV